MRIMTWTVALAGTLLLVGCSGAADPADGGTTGAAGGDSSASSSADGGGALDTTPIVFADPVFERLLKAELGTAAVSEADLAGYSTVEIVADEFVLLIGNGHEQRSVVHLGDEAVEVDGEQYTGFGTMTTLADLAHFPDVSTVFISLQPEIDYATLPELPGVTNLSVMQSSLDDLALLGSVPNLDYLTLSTNAITDLGPVAGCPS